MDLPPYLNGEELSALLPKLHNGDLEAAEKIIISHMRLIVAHVSSYHAQYLRDDLIAEGFYQLTRIVMRETTDKRKLKDENITRFIMSIVKRRLINYLHNSQIVRMKNRKEGLKQVDCIDYILKFPSNPPIEIQEILKLAIRTPNERKVITLRAQGHTQAEVAKIVGLSVSRVNQLNSAVEERFSILYEQ